MLMVFAVHNQGQNPDGQQDGDFMSEAKDWAGELISGQTGTGRILVNTYSTEKSEKNQQYCFQEWWNTWDSLDTGRKQMGEMQKTDR